jgi:hypothetical protein
MTRPPLRLARPGQLPAPTAGPDSHQVLDEAIDQLARLRTPYWLGDSAVRLHALASLIAQAQQLLPQPSTTPATRNSPGPRSASSSTPPPPPRHAATGSSHDRLDNDHRHNADERTVATHRSKVAKIARWSLWAVQSGSGSAQQPLSRSRSNGVARK